MLFKPSFMSHSGILLPFKLELESLDHEDWDILADLISNHIDFNEVHGIPRGGLLLAERLVEYAKPQTKKKRRVLIVDDVLTTGASMQEYYDKLKTGDNKVKGVVVFARSRAHLPAWVSPVFLLHGEFADDF
jgi:hypoxanthine phosphoribosyltransferase